MPDDDVNPYASPSETGSDVGPPEERVATQTATIVPVPEPYCGRVLTRFHLFGIVAIYYVAGFFLFPITGWVYIFALFSCLELIGSEYKWQIAFPFCIFFTAVPAIGIITFIWLISIIENTYWRWLLRKAIRKRPDLLVSINDPDSIVVNMIPRMNWRSVWRAEITKVRDFGLLKLDTKRSEVLIESDRERFCIPRGSILVCEPDAFHKQPKTTSVNGFVRLVVQLQDGTREIRFCLVHADYKFHSGNAKRLMALDMCQRINSLALPNS